MKLSEYIELVGIDAASKILDTKVRTLESWIYSPKKPRWQAARRIEKATKGRVKFGELYPTLAELNKMEQEEKQGEAA